MTGGVRFQSYGKEDIPVSRAIYPGSFDPVTYGHLDIIRRSADMFDQVVVGVLNNSKKSPLFTVEERVAMLQEAVKEFDNVTVIWFEGLLVDYMAAHDISVIIRGLRAITDFDYELQIAQSNRKVSRDAIDTVFLATSVEYAYLSSSMVREYASYGTDVSEFVPACVEKQLQKKYQ
jgi:pantetheine-phosphate adenylyltransferase